MFFNLSIGFTVIASEAKQSQASLKNKRLLRHFVPRNDSEKITFFTEKSTRIAHLAIRLISYYA
jgi:hypothetical protein